MLTLLGVLFALTVATAVMVFLSAARARAQARSLETLKHEIEAQLAAAEKKKQELQSELASMKTDLREQKDENKALKKKRFDEKKPVPAQATAPSTEPETILRLEKQWRDAVTELDAEKQRATALAIDLAATQQKLAAFERAQSAPVKDDAAPLRAELDAVKKRAGDQEKSVTDMRRKIEWYRRIYIVQQKEMEKEQDKTAHIRQRFLDLCADVVKLQQRVPSLRGEQGTREVERMRQEQAAYEAAQVDAAEPEKPAAEKPQVSLQ